MNTSSPLNTKARTANDRLPTILTICIIAAVYLLVFTLEQTIDYRSMVFVVLKKGAAYALVAASMNLLNGFTGLFSLGQAGFMLIGAYAYAIFTIPVAERINVYQYYGGGLVQFVVPFLVALILGGLAAALFAWLIGLPVLRLKSDYLAIATLGFAEIIRTIFQWDYLGPITNGSNMLRLYPNFDSLNFYDAAGDVTVHFSATAALLIAGICIALIFMLIHSTYGRAFKAIRDDEIAAQAMGINLARHKLMSFLVSAFFAGVGGGMLAMFMTTAKAGTFISSMTYEILLIVVIGGIGSLTGSIASAFLFVACSEWWLRFLDQPTVLTPNDKSQFIIIGLLAVVLLCALMFLRHRKANPKKRKRMYILTGAAALLLVGWLLWFQFMGGLQVPLLRTSFRTVVFAVVIMVVVLFFRRGIMGDKELPDLFRRRRRRQPAKILASNATEGGEPDV